MEQNANDRERAESDQDPAAAAVRVRTDVDPESISTTRGSPSRPLDPVGRPSEDTDCSADDDPDPTPPGASPAISRSVAWRQAVVPGGGESE